MTIREITVLRRLGQLQEALEAAEKKFAKNANNFTAGTLFWCLYDLYKNQAGDEANATLERMRGLHKDFCAGDEYVEKALAAASRRAVAHFQELKEAIETAKNGGDAVKLHKHFAGLHRNGNLDERLYPDFGWLTYYALKQTGLTEANNRKVLLNQYLKLEVPRPSILHSLILEEAIKVEKNTPLQFRFRDFMRIWGIENLRDEDWEQFRTAEGHVLPSTVEKLIGVYAKELKTDKVEAPAEFCELVDKALEKYPKSQNMPYFKATVLISNGQHDEALGYYKNLILKYPAKFYYWSQAAELTEDVDTKIGLLCKALKCGADEGLLGNVRLRLAALLLGKDLKANAKYELEKYKETYQKEGWTLKPEFWQLHNQISWVAAARDNSDLYKEYAVRAEDFVYSALPSTVAIKVAESQDDDRNHPGRKITTWILRTEKSTLRLRKPSKFGLPKRLSSGTALEIKTIDDKIVWAKPFDGQLNLPWVKEGTGIAVLRTDVKGKKYAIVANSYVPESLLKGISDGQQIKILAMKQQNGRWSAVAVLQA